MRKTLPILFFALLLAAGCSAPERKSPAIAAGDFTTLPRKEARVAEKDGTTALYSGVLLSDALASLGVPMGVHPKGRPPVESVIVEGADGYRALFSKAELDPVFADSSALLADRRNGAPLSDGEGPWRLIVTSDKIRSRWVKSVRHLLVAP